MSIQKQSYLIIVYASLLLIGGIIGFIQAGSLASILAATPCAIILFGCSYLMRQGQQMGYLMGLSLLVILLFFFIYRFFLTYHFMPAGLMILLTLGILAPLLKSSICHRKGQA